MDIKKKVCETVKLRRRTTKEAIESEDPFRLGNGKRGARGHFVRSKKYCAMGHRRRQTIRSGGMADNLGNMVLREGRKRAWKQQTKWASGIGGPTRVGLRVTMFRNPKKKKGVVVSDPRISDGKPTQNQSLKKAVRRGFFPAPLQSHAKNIKKRNSTSCRSKEKQDERNAGGGKRRRGWASRQLPHKEKKDH